MIVGVRNARLTIEDIIGVGRLGDVVGVNNRLQVAEAVIRIRIFRRVRVAISSGHAERTPVTGIDTFDLLAAWQGHGAVATLGVGVTRRITGIAGPFVGKSCCAGGVRAIIDRELDARGPTVIVIYDICGMRRLTFVADAVAVAESIITIISMSVVIMLDLTEEMTTSIREKSIVPVEVSNFIQPINRVVVIISVFRRRITIDTVGRTGEITHTIVAVCIGSTGRCLVVSHLAKTIIVEILIGAIGVSNLFDLVVPITRERCHVPTRIGDVHHPIWKDRIWRLRGTAVIVGRGQLLPVGVGLADCRVFTSVRFTRDRNAATTRDRTCTRRRHAAEI